MATMAVLCMIAKDEEGFIGRAIRSAPFDGHVIHDTGSRDGTIDEALSALGDTDRYGILYCAGWVDFSYNRNLVMDQAREEYPTSHLLWMDASDIFHGTIPVELDPNVDGYTIEHRLGELSWHRVCLVRADRPWRYEGRVHEVLVLKGSKVVPLLGCHIECNRGKPYQGRERFLRDIELLKDATDPRGVFYLAQSYLCAGEKEKAAEVYQRRADMAGWSEERYFSLVQLGLLQKQSKWFDEAVDVNPDRPEAYLYRALRDLEDDWSEAPPIRDLQICIQCVPSPNWLFYDVNVIPRAKVCLALLTVDSAMAKEIVNTVGAQYPIELLELSKG